MPAPTRRRSATVTVSLTAALALTLAGCSSSDNEYKSACVKYPEGTQFVNGVPKLNGAPVTDAVRVEDNVCRTGGGGSHGWYYFGSGSRYPAVGSRVSGGTPTLPAGAHAVSGLSKSGGTVSKSSVSRGGFGKSSSGHSVGG